MGTTRSLEFKDEKYSVKIVVRSARVSDGIQRSLMIYQARIDHPIDPNETDIRKVADRVLTAFSFPACASAVVSIENTDPNSPKKLSYPPTLEEFRELPEILAAKWEELVMDLNPQWTPGGAPSAEGEVAKSS